MFKKVGKAMDTTMGHIVLIALSIVGSFIFWKLFMEDPMVKYMKKNYQVKIEIVNKAEVDSGNMGDVWNTVALKDNENVKFDIHVTGLFFKEVLEDEYHLGLETYEVFKKLEDSLEQIQKIGFEKMEERNFVEYETYFETGESGMVEKLRYNLYLSSHKPFKNNEIDNIELERIYAVITNINSVSDEISNIYISYENMREIDRLVVKNIQHIQSKEELLMELKRSNITVSTQFVYSALNDGVTELENERFFFKKSHEGNSWIQCIKMNEKGECINYYIIILYKKDGLNKENPYLFEDIRKILSHFRNELSSNDFILKFEEDREDLNKRATINSYEINSDEDIEQFISEMYD